MAVAVVPAAGRSQRMGRLKLLLPYRGGTVVGSVVRVLRQGGALRIALVVAPGAGELASWGRNHRVTVATNPEPGRGMLSSVWAGIAALGGAGEICHRGEALLVCPADHPAIKPDTVRRLLRAVGKEGAAVAVPVCRGRRGHPVAIAAPAVPEIEGLDPGVGLRQLLERRAGETVEVAADDDPGVLLDIDTPEDYRRATEGS